METQLKNNILEGLKFCVVQFAWTVDLFSLLLLGRWKEKKNIRTSLFYFSSFISILALDLEIFDTNF